MTKWTAFFVAVLGLGSTCLSQDKQAGTPIFTAGSNFVQVPVIVQRSGKHVSGLKKDLFVLRQDGKEQIIATFEEIRGGESGRGAQTQTQFGNQAAQVPQQITVIALDTVNTPTLDRTYFIQELERYLTKPGKFEGPIGLVAIERSGIRIMTGFTNDPRPIMAAIREHANAQPSNNAQQGSDSRQISDAIISQSESELATAPDLVPLSVALKLREADDATARFQDRSARIDVQLAVQQLAQALKGIPGRKSLLLVGSGFKFIDSNIVMKSISAGLGGQEFRYSVENGGESLNQAAYTWKLLNDANVAVYPIDTRRTVNTAFQTMDTSGANTPSTLSFEQDRQADQDVLATFKTISAATGGKPCFYRTDLDNCVREAIDDDHDYYLLGFYADKKNNQPGWHKIDVKVNEKANVRYRQGFLIAKFNPEAQRKTDIGMALNSPFAYTELPFTGSFDSFTGTNGKIAKFSLEIPPDAITVDEPTGHIDFDVVAIARAAGGKEAGRVVQHIDRKFPPASIAEIKRIGINYSNRMELASGEYGVWFVVRDNLGGRTGSSVVPLKVP
ncbi:MAG TPA: VWA domain-containing protein [Terriglobales bacterium]|jgi:VWFA-related protein|nr:VWA domain-containing protein [Terriglobales bacterium]